MSPDLRLDPKFDILNPQVQDILIQAYRSKDDLAQKRNIDAVVNKFVDTRHKHFRDACIQLFTIFHSARNFRKYLCERLHRKIDNHNIFETIIQEICTEIIADINTSRIFKTKQCLQALNFIYCYMQTFTVNTQYNFIIEHAFPLYYCILQLYERDILNCETNVLLNDNDICTILQYVLQHKLLILTKAQSSFQQCSLNFVQIYYNVLRSNKLKFEILAKCGLILAHFLNCLPPEETQLLKWTNLPLIDAIDNNHNNFRIILQTVTIDNIFVGDKMLILLCSIVNSIDASILKEVKLQNGTILQTYLFLKLLRLGTEVTGHPEQIILISRTLSAMVENLDQESIFNQVFDECLAFIWAHLEHFVESVCHHTRALLSKVVNLCFVFDQQGHPQFLLSLVRNISSMSSHSYVRLSALEVMCERECSYWLKNLDQLQPFLLHAMSDEQMTVKAGNIYIRLIDNRASSLDDRDFMKCWINPVLSHLQKRERGNIAAFERIAIHGFQVKPSIFKYLCVSRDMESTVEYTILLKCIHFIRNKGVALTLYDNDDKLYWRGLIPKDDMELLMYHQCEEVRTLVLQIVVECQKTTEELTRWEMEFLLDYVAYNASTQIPSVRKKIGSLYKKMLSRFQASHKVLTRNLHLEPNLLANKQKIDYYRAFLNRFIRILLDNLVADANFSRRSLSLELLISINDISKPDDWHDCFSPNHVQNLKLMLHDSYETNKAMALSLLKTLPAQRLGFQDDESTRNYFEHCLSLAADIKPSSSLSASYMFQLCLVSPFFLKVQQLSPNSMYQDCRHDATLILMDKLNLMLDSDDNILQAAQSSPVHGILLSIRNLLQSRTLRQQDRIFAPVFVRLVTTCMRIKDNILPVVCSPSPEGFIPEDVDIFETDETSKAQLLLVYAWRTMREIMALFSELVRQTVVLESNIAMLTDENLNEIGQFFIRLFLNSRHRGVFEQAHVFFSPICHQFWRSSNSAIQTLPSKWLDEALALCTGRMTSSNLCATRRSAGLPFLILSIIASATDINSDYFHKTLKELLMTANITSESNDEYRMHCLNILRFIFIHSKLGESVATYVGQAVIVALQGFESKTWRVRNSSTLLYSALITRMFGVQRTQDSDNVCSKNKLNLAVFLLRYPDLVNFLLQTLAKECDNSDSLLLHPILMILARLYPSHTDKITFQVHDYIACLIKCLSNPTYTTRKLAARASVSLISTNKYDVQLLANFHKIADASISNNECHGLLLQIHHLLLSDHNFSTHLPDDAIKASLHLIHQAGKRFSHFTVSLYMDVLFELLTRFETIDLAVMKQIILALDKRKTGTITSENSYSWNRLQLILFIILNKFHLTSTYYSIVAHELLSSLNSNSLKLSHSCLIFFIYLNRTFGNFEEHALFTSGEVELAGNIRKLVDSFDFKTKQQLLLSTHSNIVDFLLRKFKECRSCPEDVPIFILLRFYPCVFKTLLNDGNKAQHVLDRLVCLSDSNNDEFNSAVIGCMSIFIPTIKHNMNYCSLVEVLAKSASPAASDFLRLSVAQFLVNIRDFFCQKYFQNGDVVCGLLNTMMVLLEDEELIVRNTISDFFAPQTSKGSRWKITPERARFELMTLCTKILPQEVCVGFLLSWCLRHMPEISTDTSQVYDRGELNLFAENIPIISAASKVLAQFLWSPTKNDEQTDLLCITSLASSSLAKYESPVVTSTAKRRTIDLLQRILIFLQNDDVENVTFRLFLMDKILCCDEHRDFSNVRATLLALYDPILDDFDARFKD